MFRRKLSALNCYLAETFNPNDESHFKNLMLWLEDQKIRLYPIENRSGLRNVDNKEQWTQHMLKYLEDLKCPYRSIDSVAGKMAITDWLLAFALRLDFNDNSQFYKDKVSSAQESNVSNGNSSARSENPLDNMNFDDLEFKRGVEQLASLLNITKHPDHLVTLKVVSKLISERLSNAAVNECNQQNSSADASKTRIKLDDFEAGFDTGDYVLNNAAKVLRLLYVKEMRDLQTRINETIVAMQKICADPKTDERLGKVGIM